MSTTRIIKDPSKNGRVLVQLDPIKPCSTCLHYQDGHCYAGIPHPETGSQVFEEPQLAEHIRMNYCQSLYHTSHERMARRSASEHQ